MEELSPKQAEERKRAVFESMGARGQKAILKKGYEKWDPFQMPQDPIDIRKNKTNRTTQQLVREFLHSIPSENYSNEYGRGVFDFCLGMINEDPRYMGMFDFALWYNELLKDVESEE